MTSTIAASLSEIEKIEQVREHLENCLNQKEQSDISAELAEFYIELSEIEGISIQEVIEKLRAVTEKASEIKTLIKQLKDSKKIVDKIRNLILIYDIFSEIIESYWDYLPPKATKTLSELQHDLKRRLREFKWVSVIDSILLLITRSTTGESLSTVYSKSVLRLVNAISEAVEQDTENSIDVEVVRAAKEEADREGTIPWEYIKARRRAGK
ncbi:MAG: hypothetical protein KME32_25310 [Mojavia pulchra JT2-VF2]|jgi:hypothetical protein|uniref:Uncharacterized protein n=1 Tax=Mojavia pulchra JT2-VF2 TaxID=287848 RepID=A0A951Q281_9NOST|nr:hypothetical protein [Mojavia pulchra JT2-VF2]